MEHIIYQLEEDLAILTLNRPEVANGFHIPMCEEIFRSTNSAQEDPDVHFILINANGKVFSIGGDLVEMKRAVDEDDIPSLTKIAELVNTISYKIKQIAKPVLMEVDGAVAGAAANMAVAADFCLATDKAKFYPSLCWSWFGSRCRRNSSLEPQYWCDACYSTSHDRRSFDSRKSSRVGCGLPHF